MQKSHDFMKFEGVVTAMISAGGTEIAGFVIKLGKVVCVSRVYRYSISLRI